MQTHANRASRSNTLYEELDLQKSSSQANVTNSYEHVIRNLDQALKITHKNIQKPKHVNQSQNNRFTTKGTNLALKSSGQINT